MQKFGGIEDVHRRIFAAMLANLDDSIGMIMSKLRREGLEDNTLIFFLSDNGGPTRELTSSNLPLRGGKGSLYEGGIRIPFIVQWKNELPAGSVNDHPVISLDIFATIAAATGSPVNGTDTRRNRFASVSERPGTAIPGTGIVLVLPQQGGVADRQLETRQ